MRLHSLSKKRFCAEKSNELGFSLAEMLLSLSAFCVISIILVPSVFVMESSKVRGELALQNMEWDVFLAQTKKELRMSNSVQVQSGKLVIRNGKDVIIYEKYGANLRRRVNLAGHEIVLQNISSASFLRENQTVRIQATGLKGEKYEGNVHSFVAWDDI